MGQDLQKPGTGPASWEEEIIYLSVPIPMKAELEDTALPCQVRDWQAKWVSISNRHLGALVGGEAQDSNWQLVLVGTDTGPLAVATSDGCIGGSVLSWRLCKRLGWTLAPQTLTAPAAQGLPKGWLFCRCIVHFKGARDREEGKGRGGVVGSQEQALGGTRYLPKAKP